MMGLLKLCIILSLLTTLMLVTGCKPKETTLTEFYERDLSNITKIKIVDGSTGYDVLTTNNEQIDEFISDIKNIKFIPDENQEKRDGFKYLIIFFEDDEITFQFELTKINGYYYYTEPDIEPIVKDFFKMLE